MGRSVNEDWLLRVLAIDIVIALIIVFITNFSLAIFCFIAIFFVAMIWLLYTRCAHCGNWGALYKSNTRRINSNTTQNHFTKRIDIGHSDQLDHRGNVIGRTVHYEDKDFVEVITIGIYEDTFICKYCGMVTKKQFHRQDSRETHQIN